MSRSAHVASLVISLTLATASAHAGGDFEFHPDRPLNPVSTKEKRFGPLVINPGTPGAVPATPSLKVKGFGLLNTLDDVAHIPEQAAQKGLQAVVRGIEH